MESRNQCCYYWILDEILASRTVYRTLKIIAHQFVGPTVWVRLCWMIVEVGVHSFRDHYQWLVSNDDFDEG
eukprot:scaffold656_cov271-Chaetoceros_neogracile.AAC.80